MFVAFIRNILKLFSFIPALLLMYMIYNFSAQPGEISAQLSYKVSYEIVEVVDTTLHADMADWEIDLWVTRIHGLVRKLAHMTEYFALAITVAFPLYVYGVRGIWLVFLAGAICVGFACGDEYHQSFVEGRGPSKKDVLIDSFGVFWGIILVRIIGWTGRKTIFRPLAKKKNEKNFKSKHYKNYEEHEEHSSYGQRTYAEPYLDHSSDEPADDFSDIPLPPDPNPDFSGKRSSLTDEEINELYWNSDAPYKVRRYPRKGEKI